MEPTEVNHDLEGLDEGPDGQNESPNTIPPGIEARLTNVNIRNQRHGDARVKACDLSLKMGSCPQWLIDKMFGAVNSFWVKGEGKQIRMDVDQVSCRKALIDQEVVVRDYLGEHIVTLEGAVVDKLKCTPLNGGTALAELKIRSVLPPGTVDVITDALDDTCFFEIQDLQVPLL